MLNKKRQVKDRAEDTLYCEVRWISFFIKKEIERESINRCP